MMTYDPTFSRPTSVTDPLNHKTTYVYNDTNQRITTIDPLGRRSIVRPRSANRWRFKDALGKTTYLSYLNGDLVAVADPLGRVSTRYLDDAGRSTARY